MNNLHQALRVTTGKELERVIEPLASYIIAANRPRAVLASALAILFSEIEETNKVASAHVTDFAESPWPFSTCC